MIFQMKYFYNLELHIECHDLEPYISKVFFSEQSIHYQTAHIIVQILCSMKKVLKNYIQRSGNQSIHYSQPAVWSSDWFGFYHTKPFTNSGQLAGLVTGLVYTGLYVIIIFYSDFYFSNQTILVYRYIHDMLFEFKKIS